MVAAWVKGWILIEIKNEKDNKEQTRLHFPVFHPSTKTVIHTYYCCSFLSSNYREIAIFRWEDEAGLLHMDGIYISGYNHTMNKYISTVICNRIYKVETLLICGLLISPSQGDEDFEDRQLVSQLIELFYWNRHSKDINNLLVGWNAMNRKDIILNILTDEVKIYFNLLCSSMEDRIRCIS